VLPPRPTSRHPLSCTCCICTVTQFKTVLKFLIIVRFPVGTMIGYFLFVTASRLSLGPTQPLIQRVPGALSPGTKRPGRETGSSPPDSAAIKNECSYTSNSQYVFMARCLVEDRDNFTIYLLYMNKPYLCCTLTTITCTPYEIILG
jgi:hypothetical protein